MTTALERSRSFLWPKSSWAADQWWKVIVWWEVRRVPYNFIVGITGILSCLLVLASGYVMERHLHSEAWLPDPPLFGVTAVLIYGIMANVCYTGGWVAELLARVGGAERARHFGEVAWVLGTGFSALVTCIPAVVCWLAIVLKLIAPLK